MKCLSNYSIFLYLFILIKGQPESVEMNQVSDLQASDDVIPAGVNDDDSEFSNEIVEM